MIPKLFQKLFLAFMTAGVVVALVAGLLVERQLKNGLTRWIEDELTVQAEIIALMPLEEIVAHTADVAKRSRTRLTVVDENGRVRADSDVPAIETDNHLRRTEIQEARLKGRGSAIRYSRTLKADMLYVAVPVVAGARVTGYIRLSRPLAEVGPAFDHLNRSAFHALLLILAVTLAVTLLISLRLVSPIRKLTLFTDRVRRGVASGVIRVDSRDEIGQLAENINSFITTLQEKIRTADEERRRLQSLFAGMTEGLMVLDNRARVETLNRGMEEMIGRQRADVIGRTLLEIFRNALLQDALERHRQRRETVSLEVRLGDDLPIVDVTISAVQGDADDQEWKTILVFHDVTRLKKLEQIRTDFVANVTHEIRTPLTAIIGFVETLLRGALDDGQTARKFLGLVLDNAQRLDRLVDDLLTLSGIELGDGMLSLERVAPRQVIDDVLTVIAARAAEKRLTILTEVPEETPDILADRDRLAQIFLNVIDNAVKFTPEGGTVILSASPGEAGFLTIRVADTGAGIPAAEIPRLGERFYRVDKTRSRQLGGTGLGLSIVKHLMKAHGGRLVIESALGRGTTVLLHFPLFGERP